MAYRKRNCTELNPGVHAPKNKWLIYHYFFLVKNVLQIRAFLEGFHER